MSEALPVLLPFFFNDTATTEIYTLSLHDALPICYTRPKIDESWRQEPGGWRDSDNRSEPASEFGRRGLACSGAGGLGAAKRQTNRRAIPVQRSARIGFGCSGFGATRGRRPGSY